jgi:hypothetical protein
MQPGDASPVTVVLQPACPLDFKEKPMNGVIYLVGLIVVVLFILSFLGLR